MNTRIPVVLAVALVGALPLGARAAEPKPFPGPVTKWQGFAKHDFKVGDLEATVVVPEKVLPGRPWVWRGSSSGRSRTPMSRS